jgi:multicomponent Na+:H+ antiporter subunit D
VTPETAILVAIGLPLAGALAIALAGRVSPNLRETVTLLTAAALIWVVWGLLPTLMDGGRPAVEVSQVMPGLTIAFRVEPLGMLFAALASGLWIINSIYSIGYMRGNQEQNQTRFFTCFALALAATMGVAFAGNLFTLFLFYELLTLSTYPLVAHKGDEATVRSARIYLGVLLSTSIGLFLPAIIWTYTAAGTGDFTPVGFSPVS